MSNEITAFFKGRIGVAESVYQYDYGMVLVIDGLDFTNDFDCYFSTSGEDEAIPAIGSDNRVAIPNDCLTRAGDVTLHIPLHTGENDSEVEYVASFKVIGRARPVDDGTEEEQSAVSKAIALLNHTNSSVIETIDQYLDENAAESIQDWLDEHPEATTTVQDGSLTNKKFVIGTLGYVIPEMFGAVGDGISDDTTSMQNTMNFAAANRMNVLLKNHYKVSSVIVPNGVRSIVGGTIVGNGTVDTGIVVLGSEENPLKKCKVSIEVDMSNGEAMGISGLYCEECVFDHCHVFGCTDHETAKRYLLRVVGSVRNIFTNNKLEGVIKPNGAYQYLLIMNTINDETVYGGIFDGNHQSIAYSETPVTENIVKNNLFTGGTHSVVVSSGIRNVFEGNICKYATHRGIALQSACTHNLICNNHFHAIQSAGVLMTYGCLYNEIIGNLFTDDLSVISGSTGEGAICGYLHIKYNKIIGNKIMTARLYSVYLAVDVVGNIIENNTMAEYYLAGVDIEADWIPAGQTWKHRTKPDGLIFSRYASNEALTDYTDSSGNLMTYVGFVDSTGNVIQNNIFEKGSGSSSAQIYLVQVGDRLKLKDNIVKGNVFTSTNASSQYYIYLFEETADYCISNYLLDNKIHGSGANANRFFFSRWRRHFVEQSGNTVLDDAWNLVTGSSFSAKNGKLFRLNNSSATTLTSITDTVQKQEVLLRLDANTTIQHAGGGNIRLKGGANVTPQGNTAILCLINLDGSTLFEKYRNF